MIKKNSNLSLKKFFHSIGQNWFHLVIIPKKRFRVFQYGKTRIVAEEAFYEVCKTHKIDVFELQVIKDYVHLFVDCFPDYGIRQLFRILKRGTSFYIRKKVLSLKFYSHFWSTEYMYKSISDVTVETT